jgi:hypothetical protein
MPISGNRPEDERRLVRERGEGGHAGADDQTPHRLQEATDADNGEDAGSSRAASISTEAGRLPIG